jgi:deleted-in-malignant-brain-tumors protein 1
MIIISHILNTESLTRDNCNHGDVQLVGTPLSSLGIVEVCLDSYWGRVCRDRWSNYDAIVVCNQLGFGRDGK